MIRFVAQTGSTNAELARQIRDGTTLDDGCWIVANRQTAGRGRQGRPWFDGAGNFMGSTLVRARVGDPALPSLALVAGLAVHGAVSKHLPPPIQPMLKWPNDLMVKGAKIAGILLERLEDVVVVGIGVNLSVAPQIDGRETIALSAFGPSPDRDLFAHDLAAAFVDELIRWRGFGIAPLVSRWQSVAHPAGTALAVGEPGEPALHGRFAGLDADGALLLGLPDGTTRTVNAGEVRLAGPA